MPTFTFTANPDAMQRVYVSFRDFANGPEGELFAADPLWGPSLRAEQQFMEWFEVTNLTPADPDPLDGNVPPQQHVEFSTEDELVAWQVRNALACMNELYYEEMDGERMYGNPFDVAHPEQ